MAKVTPDSAQFMSRTFDMTLSVCSGNKTKNQEGDEKQATLTYRIPSFHEIPGYQERVIDIMNGLLGGKRVGTHTCDGKKHIMYRADGETAGELMEKILSNYEVLSSVMPEEALALWKSRLEETLPKRNKLTGDMLDADQLSRYGLTEDSPKADKDRAAAKIVNSEMKDCIVDWFFRALAAPLYAPWLAESKKDEELTWAAYGRKIFQTGEEWVKQRKIYRQNGFLSFSVYPTSPFRPKGIEGILMVEKKGVLTLDISNFQARNAYGAVQAVKEMLIRNVPGVTLVENGFSSKRKGRNGEVFYGDSHGMDNSYWKYRFALKDLTADQMAKIYGLARAVTDSVFVKSEIDFPRTSKEMSPDVAKWIRSAYAGMKPLANPYEKARRIEEVKSKKEAEMKEISNRNMVIRDRVTAYVDSAAIYIQITPETAEKFPSFKEDINRWIAEDGTLDIDAQWRSGSYHAISVPFSRSGGGQGLGSVVNFGWKMAPYFESRLEKARALVDYLNEKGYPIRLEMPNRITFETKTSGKGDKANITVRVPKAVDDPEDVDTSELSPVGYALYQFRREIRRFGKENSLIPDTKDAGSTRISFTFKDLSADDSENDQKTLLEAKIEELHEKLFREPFPDIELNHRIIDASQKAMEDFEVIVQRNLDSWRDPFARRDKSTSGEGGPAGEDRASQAKENTAPSDGKSGLEIDSFSR